MHSILCDVVDSIGWVKCRRTFEASDYEIAFLTGFHNLKSVDDFRLLDEIETRQFLDFIIIGSGLDHMSFGEI